MKRSPARQGLINQRGQAAVECAIMAAFVLVPLFLLIPLLGKYIDIKQAAIQQARFEVWEYTAWFDREEQIMHGIRSEYRSGRRDFAVTRARGNRLFFTDSTAADYGGPEAVDRPNPLWVDQRGEPLLVRSSLHPVTGELRQQNTPDPTSGLVEGGLINDTLGLVNWVVKLFGKLLHALGIDATFDALNTKGYFTSFLTVEVRPPGEVVPDLSALNKDLPPLAIQAQAAVLSRGWNAGSTAHASSESRGLVVTALLEPVSRVFNSTVDILQRVVNVAAHVVPIKVKLPHGPQFGHVKDDLIPYEHLQNDVRTVKEQYGLSYYESLDP